VAALGQGSFALIVGDLARHGRTSDGRASLEKAAADLTIGRHTSFTSRSVLGRELLIRCEARALLSQSQPDGVLQRHVVNRRLAAIAWWPSTAMRTRLVLEDIHNVGEPRVGMAP
jgi:hypothetical protein